MVLWGSFPSCVLWAYQSVRAAKMFHLLMRTADFWLGSVPHHFRSCSNTWQLMGSNPVPSLLVLTRLARHNGSFMVWQSCPTPPRPTGDKCLAWRALCDKGAPRQSWGVTASSGHTAVMVSSCLWPELTIKFESRGKSLLLVFGLCLSIQLAMNLGCISNA